MGSCCRSGTTLEKPNKYSETKPTVTQLINPNIPSSQDKQNIAGLVFLEDKKKLASEIIDASKNISCKIDPLINNIKSDSNFNDKDDGNHTLRSSFSIRRLLPKRKDATKEIVVRSEEDKNNFETHDNIITNNLNDCRYNIQILNEEKILPSQLQ